MEVRSGGRARALGLLGLVAIGSTSVFSVALRADDSTATPRGLASEAVREALQHEVYGLTEERARLLKEAAEHDPKYDPARWHSGEVRDDQGKWVDHEQFRSSAGVADKLKEYAQVREKHADTVEGQLALAAWCAKRKLFDQQRAHLSRVIELSPEHPEAREALGFVRLDGAWVSRSEIAAEEARARAAERNLRTWRPRLAELVKDLRHRSEERREKAKERIASIHDPAAIPALTELVLGAKDEEEAEPFLNAIAQIQAPDAALALTNIAAFSTVHGVRLAAAEKLGERDFNQFVPHLLASLYSPVTSQMAATLLPNGRLAFRQVFMREGMDRRDVLQLDTEYVRRERVGGNRQESTGRAAVNMLSQAMAREQAAQQQNAMIKAMNDRIMWVLSHSTGQQFADPAGWWSWWTEFNEVFQAGSKNVAFVQQTSTVQVVDYVPPMQPQRPNQSSGGSGGGVGGQVTQTRSGGRAGVRQLDCLAAGTKVWTIDGLTNIESVRVGDLLLSRSPETGELSYKPVLRTTVRPAGELVKLTIDGETIETSGGHLFWVSGEGWVRSRNLQAGMLLHGVDGPSHVQSVEQGQTAETYNVAVADFNTYFIGAGKVMSHDNTIRRPTQSVVPGLAIE